MIPPFSLNKSLVFMLSLLQIFKRQSLYYSCGRCVVITLSKYYAFLTFTSDFLVGEIRKDR